MVTVLPVDPHPAVVMLALFLDQERYASLFPLFGLPLLIHVHDAGVQTAHVIGNKAAEYIDLSGQEQAGH
jgi:hypothetical protein